jgi:hypothetical protein
MGVVETVEAKRFLGKGELGHVLSFPDRLFGDWSRKSKVSLTSVAADHGKSFGESSDSLTRCAIIIEVVSMPTSVLYNRGKKS